MTTVISPGSSLSEGNSVVWDEARERAHLELGQLRALLDTYADLLAVARKGKPDATQVLAVAAVLHSFYTGIENIFKRVAKDIDGRAPRGAEWHRQLLDAMESGTDRRPGVISPELRAELEQYLNFRHVFRQGYSHQIRWPRMKHLVLGSEDVLNQLRAELDTFFSSTP